MVLVSIANREPTECASYVKPSLIDHACLASVAHARPSMDRACQGGSLMGQDRHYRSLRSGLKVRAFHGRPGGIGGSILTRGLLGHPKAGCPKRWLPRATDALSMALEAGVRRCDACELWRFAMHRLAIKKRPPTRRFSHNRPIEKMASLQGSTVTKPQTPPPMEIADRPNSK